MKKSIPILLAVLLCLCTQTFAQNRADELMKQAQENLAKKEYIKARYLFLQAYNAFATQENYAQAVKCGVNAAPSITGRIIIKKHSNCCAMPNCW